MEIAIRSIIDTLIKIFQQLRFYSESFNEIQLDGHNRTKQIPL